MSLIYAERIAQVATYIASRDTHGYSQSNRSGDGTTETAKFSDGTSFTVHGGDYDCSEMARVCANCAISGKYTGPIPDMWTGNQYERLTAQGFRRIAFSKGAVKRGDILWVKGHTGIALGDGRQADAHGDEVGGITGPRKGDQTGHEIEVRDLRTNWTYMYRKEGSKVAYSNSSLASERIFTPKHSGTRGHAIDTITPHYVVGYSKARDVATYLRDTPTRQASANYIIGKDGEIVLNVEEKNRSWCSSSSANDNRAITIECANYMNNKNGHVYGQLPNATWASLVALCADICKRNGKKRLVYRGKADYSGLKSTDMLLTMHKWFASTDCPGPWLSKQFDRLVKEVNAKLGSSTSTSSTSAAKKKTTTTTKPALASGYKKDASFAGTYRCTVASLNIRRAPSTSGKVVGEYKKGEKVVLEGYWWKANGCIWGTYVGGSGNRNYVAVGKATGKVEASDYLVKV